MVVRGARPMGGAHLTSAKEAVLNGGRQFGPFAASGVFRGPSAQSLAWIGARTDPFGRTHAQILDRACRRGKPGFGDGRRARYRRCPLLRLRRWGRRTGRRAARHRHRQRQQSAATSAAGVLRLSAASAALWLRPAARGLLRRRPPPPAFRRPPTPPRRAPPPPPLFDATRLGRGGGTAPGGC